MMTLRDSYRRKLAENPKWRDATTPGRGFIIGGVRRPCFQAPAPAFYRCACGYEFELPLGKHGCPSCEGTHTATIVMKGGEPWP